MKYSIIIPSLGCSPRLIPMLYEYNKSDFVGEIIVINNNKNIKYPQDINKLVVVDQEENIFVNPAWNLGISLAKYSIILANDDITFPNVTDVLKKLSKSNYDIVGLCLEDSIGELCINDIKEFPAKGYGCFMYIKNPIYIPEQIKIWRGDALYFNHSTNRGILCNTGVQTEVSTTVFSKEHDFIPICKKDRLEYNKLKKEERFNIIIRTSERPNYFDNCIRSIKRYAPNSKLHIIVDNIKSLEYVNKCDLDFNYYLINKETIQNTCNKIKIEREPFIYNYYLNIVKPFIQGWCMILDDDDELTSTPIAPQDTNFISLWKVDIVKRVVPSDINFKKLPKLNDISMIGIIFHSSKRVDFIPQRGGDYDFILSLYTSCKVEWVDKILAKTQTGGNRGKKVDLPEINKKRIGIVVPCWGRPDILRIFNIYLEKFMFFYLDKLNFSIIFVLSKEDKYYEDILENCRGFFYKKYIIEVENKNLGEKINTGINEALEIGCDYIMNLDSDDLLHQDLLDLYIPEIRKGTDIFGVKSVYFVDNDGTEVAFSNSYSGRNVLSTARMIKREVIEDVKKKYTGIYEDSLNRGLGTSSSIRMREFGYKQVSVYEGDFPYIIDIKSSTNINPFTRIALDPEIKIINKTKEELFKQFKF